MKPMQPTYYVRHSDDSYTVADPQPMYFAPLTETVQAPNPSYTPNSGRIASVSDRVDLRPFIAGASPSEAAINDVMDKFESWYVDFGEEAFNKISDREYVQDDCTDMRKVMREVAILAWLARTSSSGQGSTPDKL